MRDEKRASYELAGRKLLKTRTELILFRNAFCTSRTISRSAHKERKIWFYAIFVLPHNQICQDMLEVASSALLKSVSHKLCFLPLVLPSLKASKLFKLSSVVPPPYTSLVNTLKVPTFTLCEKQTLNMSLSISLYFLNCRNLPKFLL